MTLDEIDRSTKLNAAVEFDRTRDRSRIRRPLRTPAIKAERQLEMPRHKTGLVNAGAPQPFAQIGADGGDAVKPDALDGGSKVVVVPRSNIGDDGIELPLNPIEDPRPYRKQTFAA